MRQVKHRVDAGYLATARDPCPEVLTYGLSCRISLAKPKATLRQVRLARARVESDFLPVIFFFVGVLDHEWELINTSRLITLDTPTFFKEYVSYETSSHDRAGQD